MSTQKSVKFLFRGMVHPLISMAAPLKRFEEARRMVVDFHLPVAGERVGRHFGQTKLAATNRLLAFL
jgi:hypothetical protein